MKLQIMNVCSVIVIHDSDDYKTQQKTAPGAANTRDGYKGSKL